MKKLLTAVALAAAAFGANAQLTYSGGDPLTSFSGYNPSGSTVPQSAGLVDATISAAFAGTLSATFLGFEAVDNDTYGFLLSSGVLSNRGSIGSSVSGRVSAGALSFSFSDLTTGETVGNGGNANASVYSSYVILGTFTGGVFSPYTMGGAYQLVLGFNDGLKVDADYDDLVVGLRLNPVPEPETYALMLAGLGALGFIGRRRRKTLDA